MKTKLFTGILLLAALCRPAAGQDEPGQKPLRNFQFSLLPMIGTEGAEVIHHQYRISINLLAGVTGGVQGLELGGFLNITKGGFTGIQLSGFGNVVTSNFKGLQASGTFNMVRGNAQAFMVTGFVNMTTGSFEGFQGSGFANVAGGSTKGFLGAGFANIAGGSTKGFRGAGFANVAGGSHEGFAGAGFANVAGGSALGFLGAGFGNFTGEHALGFLGAGFGNFTGGHAQGFLGAGFGNFTGGHALGFLGAGFGNFTGGHAQGFLGAGFGNFTGGNAEGAQFAGFMNKSGNMKGIQAAGFINIAREVDGLQLGIINVADTIAGGVPIGLVSFVRRGGLMQVELAGSDVMSVSVAFRTGVPHFYNIFSLGMRPFADEQFSSFGMGFGTGFAIGRQATFQVEAHSYWLGDAFGRKRREPEFLNELRPMLSMKLIEGLELFAGPVLQQHLVRMYRDPARQPRDIESILLISERKLGDFRCRWWLGARGGLRFNLQ